MCSEFGMLITDVDRERVKIVFGTDRAGTLTLSQSKLL